MITNQDRSAIRRLFRKVKEDTDRLVAEKAARSGGALTHPEMPNIIAAQNTLRACMEVVFDECLPYGEFFLAEMAIRLGTYSISAAPIERHDVIVDAVVKNMARALQNRVAEGSVIKTRWLTDGVDHPNLPSKGDIQ